MRLPFGLTVTKRTGIDYSSRGAGSNKDNINKFRSDNGVSLEL